MAEEQTKKRRMGTIENMKTAMTARVHSKPPAEGQEYLELWSLKRDRARWVRTKAQAEERIEGIDKMIEGIDLPEENQRVSGDEPEPPRVARTIDFNNCAKR